jgi:hypothetical protein
VGCIPDTSLKSYDLTMDVADSASEKKNESELERLDGTSLMVGVFSFVAMVLLGLLVAPMGLAVIPKTAMWEGFLLRSGFAFVAAISGSFTLAQITQCLVEIYRKLTEINEKL